MNAFAGRTAIVTGAGSGIGAELARQLTAHEAIVLATDINEHTVRAVAEETGATAMAVDVADRAGLAAAIDRVVAEHGRLDFLFNNAGVAIFGDFEAVTLDDWDKIIDVNLRGVAYGSALAYRRMAEQGHGHIVNTASVAGLVPVPLQAHYTATKHAVVGMSKTLAVEAKNHGVRVTTFCPGFVDTGMFVHHTFRGTLEGADGRELVPIKPLPPERAVRTLLAGVASGRALVITPFYGKLNWWLERFSPALSARLQRLILRVTRARVQKAKR